MGKIHVNHKVVIRKSEGKIVSETEHADFAKAAPVYEGRKSNLAAGCVLTLQHGIRIIKSYQTPE